MEVFTKNTILKKLASASKFAAVKAAELDIMGRLSSAEGTEAVRKPRKV